ncbi:MAG: DUF1318 domain-containing protein [Burkholderiales bacterium]|nr:DUF1318 domain-containing protein [Burkholderiales bacterium]
MTRRLAAVVAMAAALLLAACGSASVHTAAAGTVVQAREVVRAVYGQAADPVAGLPYRAPDIARVVARMTARFAELRAALESGAAGLTSEAYVALRDPASSAPALRALVRRENLDRSILYGASASEVGHGINDWFGDWMPFERESFAREWIGQAPAGWWYRDERGNWVRKSAEAAGPRAAPAQR